MAYYGQRDGYATWNAPAPLSAPPTLRGIPTFDAKPGKSILKRNQSTDEQLEGDAATAPTTPEPPHPPKFFLGTSTTDAKEDAAAAAAPPPTTTTVSPSRARKSVLKKYNPYHTFSPGEWTAVIHLILVCVKILFTFFSIAPTQRKNEFTKRRCVRRWRRAALASVGTRESSLPSSLQPTSPTFNFPRFANRDSHTRLISESFL